MVFVVQFVDSIAASPTVRLDLNDRLPWKVLAAETDLSPPPLKRAVVDTLLTDGEQIPASAYGNRVIRLALDFTGVTGDDAADALQDLAREVDRPTNFLRWQPETTHPVYFRTLRSDIGQVQWDKVTRQARLQLLAEPFAYGLPETLPAVTVNNDPAAATNGMFFDVTGVKGDVSAATKITQTAGSLILEKIAFATRRRGNPANTPFLLQAESMLQLTDTTTQPNDPNMSGAGNNFSRCTFVTNANLTARLSVTAHPATPSADARGQYRVFGVFRKSVTNDVITVQLEAGPSGVGSLAVISTVVLPSGTNEEMVDLGLLQIPYGEDPVTDGPSGVVQLAKGVEVELLASRTGTGVLDIDFLIFAPADDLFSLIEIGEGNLYAWDSYLDSSYGHDGVNVISCTENVALGGLPELMPNVINRVYFMRGTGGTYSVFRTTTFDVKYWPRYLYVRPVSS